MQNRIKWTLSSVTSIIFILRKKVINVMEKKHSQNRKNNLQDSSAFVVEVGKGKEFLERFNQSKEKSADFWNEIREIKHRDQQKYNNE